jgi:CRP-like cAMP-binding protein
MDHDKTSQQVATVSQYLFRKLRGFFSLTSHIQEAIQALCTDVVEFGAREPIIRQGEGYRHLYLIESGWVLRARHLPDGTRQIVNVAIPGDFLCFNAALFNSSDFDLTAKTNVSAFRFERVAVGDLFKQYPELAVALAWTNAHEEAMLAERVVSLGRRNARERMAHVLCELEARLHIVSAPPPAPVQQAGERGAGVLAIPLTQEDFADLLGMSPIHVNRTLRSLAGAALVHYKVGQVQILDLEGLARIAGFDKGYLHFTQRSDVLPR